MENNPPKIKGTHGGARPGGGRPKGSPNKATQARQAEIAASGLTPLDYMLAILRDETAEHESRKWAAQNAAPYVHPKLSSVEAKVDTTINAYDWLLGQR